LEDLGVEVRTNTVVEMVDDTGVVVRHEPRGQEGGPSQTEHIDAKTLIWTAGVRTTSVAARLAEAGANMERGGRITVKPDLTLPGHPDVFVVGDLAAVPQDGKLLAGVAPVAMQEGRYAADLILSRLAGRRRPAFHYRDRGSLATIGRSAAIADLPNL